MAEAIGIVGAAVGIAAEGLRLSQTLYEFVEKARLADADIKEIADDVKSTAIVLEQFGASLKLDEESMICSKEFYRVTSENIQDCSQAFISIDKALQKSIKAVKDVPLTEASDDRVYELRKRDKFWWSFKQTRVEKLRSNLERLKANLNLKMQVMAHAREVHERQLASKANENDEKIKALRVEMLALEAQEAERKYQEIKKRIDESQGLFEKGPQNGEPNLDKGNQDVWDPETPQDVAQGGNIENSSLDAPGPKPSNSNPKRSDDNGGRADLPLPFSKIELLLSRIAGAQEAIVLATEKQGSFDRSADPFPAHSAPLLQERSAGNTRMIKEVGKENLHQDDREPEKRHRRPISDEGPLDRVRNVQERFTELAKSQGLSQRDASSRRNEHFNLEEDYISQILKEGDKMSLTSEESQEEALEEDDAVPTITCEEPVVDGEEFGLRLGQVNYHPDTRMESEDWEKAGWSSLMTSAFENNENSSPEPSSRWRDRSKGKDEQTTIEQAMSNPPLNARSAGNLAPFDTLVDTSVELVQRLTSSTGALVLHADHSRWTRGITHPPEVSSMERNHHSQSPFSWPSSPPLVANRSSSLDAGYALESQPSPPRKTDTLNTQMGGKVNVELSPCENEPRKSVMEQIKIDQDMQPDHQFFEEILPKSEVVNFHEVGERSHDSNERGHSDTKGDSARDGEFSTRESIDHNQANDETSASEGQLGSLLEPITGENDDFENADLLENDEVPGITNNQNPTLSTQPRSSVSEDEVCIIQDIPGLDHRDMITDAESPNATATNNHDPESPNATAANNHDPEISPKKDSNFVETVILPSRLGKLRALLRRRSIVRRNDAEGAEDAIRDSQDSTTSTDNGRKGRNRNRGLGLLVTAFVHLGRFGRTTRGVKRWFFGPWRLSSSSISDVSYSYTSYSSSESSDEERYPRRAYMKSVADVDLPKSRSRDRQRPIRTVQTNLSSIAHNPISKKDHRDSQKKDQIYRKRKSDGAVTVGPTEYIDVRHVSEPAEHLRDPSEDVELNSPEVVDLDQPSESVPIGFVGSHEVRTLEAWLLRPDDSISEKSSNWRRVRRIFIPLGAEELEEEVQKFNQKTKKLHSKPLWSILRSLSSDQQQHIERLLEMKRACDKDQNFQWTLVALKVGPRASLKPHDKIFIQIIIKGHLHSNAVSMSIGPHNPSITPASRPLAYPDQRPTLEPLSLSVQKIIPGSPRRQKLRNHSISPTRVMTSSPKGKGILKQSDPSDVAYRSRQSETAELGFPPMVARGPRNRGLGDKEEKKKEGDMKRTMGREGFSEVLKVKGIQNKQDPKQQSSEQQESWREETERIRSKTQGLEREAQDLEREKEKLQRENDKLMEEKSKRMELQRLEEEMKRLESKQRSFERRRVSFDDDDWDLIDSDPSTYPSRPRPPRTWQAVEMSPLRAYPPSRYRDASTLGPYDRSRYPPARVIYNAEPPFVPEAPASPVDEPTTSEAVREVRNLPNRSARPNVRFDVVQRPSPQDVGARSISAYNDPYNDPGFGLSGPLYGPAGAQFRPPSPVVPPLPVVPKPSIPAPDTTLNNLISQWTNLKIDPPTEKAAEETGPTVDAKLGEGSSLPTHRMALPPAPLRRPRPLNYSDDLPYGSELPPSGDDGDLYSSHYYPMPLVSTEPRIARVGSEYPYMHDRPEPPDLTRGIHRRRSAWDRRDPYQPLSRRYSTSDWPSQPDYFPEWDTSSYLPRRETMEPVRMEHDKEAMRDYLRERESQLRERHRMENEELNRQKRLDRLDRLDRTNERVSERQRTPNQPVRITDERGYERRRNPNSNEGGIKIPPPPRPDLSGNTASMEDWDDSGNRTYTIPSSTRQTKPIILNVRSRSNEDDENRYRGREREGEGTNSSSKQRDSSRPRSRKRSVVVPTISNPSDAYNPAVY